MSTILLVDNDPLQGFLCKSILERRFRDVQRVRDAAEALCLVEQPKFAGNLGLVISSLNMPGIGGPAFVTELHERLPKVPVLVLGGGSESARDFPARDFPKGWVRFLARPCVGEQILAAASEMLEQHSSEAA
jgi:DNA-binding NtrC family response regulator